MVKHTFTVRRYGWYFIAAALLSAFVGIYWIYFMQIPAINDNQIVQDIELLQQVFTRINQKCDITGFRHDKNYIDFLTVKEFEGSEIGAMELEHPEKWEGPYLPKNLTIEGVEYQIVRLFDQYYIMPGDGVTIANGHVVGKTVAITPHTSFESLVSGKQGLVSTDNKPLIKLVPTLIEHQRIVSEEHTVED